MFKGVSYQLFFFFKYLNSVVSYACYPSFWKSHLEPSGENHCYVSSEYGKNHTNGPCPNALVESNRLYRCAAHYRVSSKVSSCCSPLSHSVFSTGFENYPAYGNMFALLEYWSCDLFLCITLVFSEEFKFFITSQFYIIFLKLLLVIFIRDRKESMQS